MVRPAPLAVVHRGLRAPGGGRGRLAAQGRARDLGLGAGRPRAGGGARRRIAFEALDGDAVAVSLELEYGLKSPGFAGPVVDLLFVRRALGDSLRRTLERFARELMADLDAAREATR